MKINFKSSWYITIASAAFILTACNVSKKAVMPDAGTPANFRGTNNADSNSIGQIARQIFFADTVLNRLIDDALAHNYDQQIALKNIEAAALLFKQSKWGNIPSLVAGVNASLSRPSDNSLNGLSLTQFLGASHIEDYSLGASLSWEADIWGKIKSRKDAALAAYLQTQEARNAVRLRIVNDIAKSYYNLLLLDTKLGIAKRNVALNDSTIAIIQLQFTYGHANALAVQQSFAQRLTAAALIPAFEREMAIQENAISVLSGHAPGDIIRYSSLNEIVFPSGLQAGLPATVVAYRPDVRQSELLVREAMANEASSKASLYPSLTITAQAGLDAIKAGNWFNIPASLFGAVAGSLTQPVINQKKLRTQYELSQVKKEQTVFVFRQTVLQALGEVSDALVQIDKLTLQEELVTNLTDTLQLSIHNAQSLYRSGLADYLEVIVVQASVLQSELELATIKKSRLDAIVDLYKATGGGQF